MRQGKELPGALHCLLLPQGLPQGLPQACRRALLAAGLLAVGRQRAWLPGSNRCAHPFLPLLLLLLLLPPF